MAGSRTKDMAPRSTRAPLRNTAYAPITAAPSARSSSRFSCSISRLKFHRDDPVWLSGIAQALSALEHSGQPPAPFAAALPLVSAGARLDSGGVLSAELSGT